MLNRNRSERVICFYLLVFVASLVNFAFFFPYHFNKWSYRPKALSAFDYKEHQTFLRSQDETYVSYDIREVCHCRRTESINFVQNKSNPDLFTVVLKAEQSASHRRSYQVNVTELNRTTCDIYNTLRRGKSQRVYSVSLYGKHGRYYQLLTCRNLFIF